jgi:hypothetical protein
MDGWMDGWMESLIEITKKQNIYKKKTVNDQWNIGRYLPRTGITIFVIEAVVRLATVYPGYWL